MDRYEMANTLEQMLDKAETAQIMKEIPGFEEQYSITPTGQVWSHRENHFINGWENGNGYMIVGLYNRELGKIQNKRIHRLVAETYIPKPDYWTPGMKLDVGHKNDIRNDNNIENLFWCTRKENLDTDHFREAQSNKLFTKVRCIETGEVYDSIKAAGEAIGKHPYGINLCLLGKQQTCGGYHWERLFEN